MKIQCLSDLDKFRLAKNKKKFVNIATKEYYTFEEIQETPP